jgi:hypothetical protein
MCRWYPHAMHQLFLALPQADKDRRKTGYRNAA